MSPGEALPAAAWVVALAALPEVGPARLAALLRRGSAADVFSAVASGGLELDAELADACRRRDPRPLVEGWRVAARALDVGGLWRRHLDAGTAVLVPGSPGWPARLSDDPDPPAVLFAHGDLGVLDRPCVAVVGTRRCSRYGWDVGHRLGHDLAAAGVCVVSGLARGIDGAAHRGALDAPSGAPPAGVVATGLDVPYPRANASLWREVAAAGVVVAEAPLGTEPARWRFPARNRIIAALADVVVVVESATTGGALHTVDEALRRDRPVLAVPGPVTSPASAGTNRLLRDVAAPACDAGDVLVALGLVPGAIDRGGGGGEGPGGAGTGDPLPGDADATAVLDALGATSASLDALVAASALPLARVAAAVARLEVAGAVVVTGATVCRAHRGREVTL